MRRRSLATAAFVLGGLTLLALVAGWMLRFRIATSLVDRTLAGAHVPASYQLTRIGPFRERIENVRVGDPDLPDLVARRIDVELGYSWMGPTVRAIRIEGMRLRARLDRNGLSLGTIDKFLPKSGEGRIILPDLRVGLHDVRLELTTPNGAIRAAIEGAGNPQIGFQGTARVDAPALRLASCALTGLKTKLRITTRRGAPQAAGPIRIARTTCPGMRLATGGAQMKLFSDKLFETIALKAMLEGFSGQAGPAHFADISGPIEASGRIGDLTARARLSIRSLALPDAARDVAQIGNRLAGTPVGPTGQRAAGAFARLLAKANAQADLAAKLRGTRADIGIRRIQFASDFGEYLRVTEHGGITWTAQGWRADADIAAGGGAVPVIKARLRQAAPGAALTGVLQLSDYQAADAKFAATPIGFRWDGRRATFDTAVKIDGPIGDGFVRGLAMPVRGIATAAGALILGRGCQPVHFQRARLASFTLSATDFTVCGLPIVAHANGRLRIDASAGPIRLSGYRSEGGPVTVSAMKLRMTEAVFTAVDVNTALGPEGRQTHLAISMLNGRIGKERIAGQFNDARGAIANIPLTISNADGMWSFSDGSLRLKGDLQVSDSAAATRFNPLSTDDALLSLKDNAIRATAILREPSGKAEIAKVSIDHDLVSGAGHAQLEVGGITFTPKGLQPEKLTPLTLGVVANVAGTVSGHGRIDWGPKGVTSSGTFGTDRIDLAAAFGPVTGIKSQVHFIDLLGLVSAPDQEARVAEVNPGVAVTDGLVHYQLTGQNRVKIGDATWPFAGGTLRLDPTELDFRAEAERHLTFRIEGLNAAAFVQQLDFPNIAATGTFDGVLPMIFDHTGGRIEAGQIIARSGGGTLAYVGELSNADLGAMGKLAFDALKAIRYSSLDISLDGRLDGEMVSRVRFTGVREATPKQSLITRLIRNLPFRFNIQIRAPFRGLVGSARAYMDPRLLLNQASSAPRPQSAISDEPSVQTQASGSVR